MLRGVCDKAEELTTISDITALFEVIPLGPFAPEALLKIMKIHIKNYLNLIAMNIQQD